MKSILFVCLFLVACDDSPRKIIGPNGEPGVAVNCSFGGTGKCLEDISKACPKGYTITSELSFSMIALCK